MLQTTDKIIQHKVGVLNLAEELGDISRVSRFYIECPCSQPPQPVS